MSACGLSAPGAAYGELARNKNLNFEEGAKKTFSAFEAAPAAVVGFITGRSNNQTVETNMLSTAIANVTTNATFTCTGNVTDDQTVEVSCATDPSEVVGNGCTTSHYVMDSGIPATTDPNYNDYLRLNIEFNESQIRLDAIENYGAPSSGNYLFGIEACLPGTECAAWKGNTQVQSSSQYACTSCVVQAVKQASHVSFSEGCNSDVHITNALKTNLSEQIQQLLKNQKDVSGEAGEILSQGSMDCITNDLTNRILDRVDDTFTTALRDQMEDQQALTIESGSGSVWMTNFEQFTNANSMSSIISNMNITHDLYTSEETKEAQDLIAKNADIEDLAKDLEGVIVGLGDILESTMGKMIFVIGGVMIALIIVVVAFSIADPETTDAMLGRVMGR